MYRNRLTKETYSNRKEAKITLGASRFNRLFKEKIIYFIDNIPSANYGISTNTENKALGLNANEAYTYFCLLAKSDYNTYISHVKLETLSELTGIKKQNIYPST